MKEKFKDLCIKLIASIDEHCEQFPDALDASIDYYEKFGTSQFYQILEEIRNELEKTNLK
jgi:hypothetical protein